MAWNKFRKLLPVLTSRHVSLKTRGKVFSSAVRSALLHGSESWAPNAHDLQRLRRNDRAMVRWICAVKPNDTTPSSVLHERLGVCDINTVLQARRLRWYGHVERASPTSSIASTLRLDIPSSRGRGRPRKTWMDCVKQDRKTLNLSSTDPLDRDAWRAGVTRRVLPTPATGNPAAL